MALGHVPRPVTVVPEPAMTSPGRRVAYGSLGAVKAYGYRGLGYRHHSDLTLSGADTVQGRGRAKPGCRIVGSSTRCALTTEADFQDC